MTVDCYRDETLEPVLTVVRVDSDDEAHMYSPEGVQAYTRAKVVTARWPDPGTSRIDLGFPRTR